MRAHSGGCAWRRDVGRIRANAVGGTAASAPGGNRTRGLRLESVTIVSPDVRDVAASFARSNLARMPFAMQFGELERRQEQIAEGDLVVTRWTAMGTNDGELMGMSPTGKSVKIEGIGVDRIADGKVVESWGCWDTLGMMQQLGAIPEAQPAGV